MAARSAPSRTTLKQAAGKLVASRRNKIESFMDQIKSLQNAAGQAMATLKPVRKRPPPLTGIRVCRGNSSSWTPSNRRGSRRSPAILASPVTFVSQTPTRKCVSSRWRCAGAQGRRGRSSALELLPTDIDSEPGGILGLKALDESESRRSQSSQSTVTFDLLQSLSTAKFDSPQMRCLPGVGFHLVRTRAFPGKPYQLCEALVARVDSHCQNLLSSSTNRIALM